MFSYFKKISLKNRKKNGKEIARQPEVRRANRGPGGQKFFNFNFKKIVAVLITIFLFAYFWNSISVTVYPGQAGVLWKRFSSSQKIILDDGFHLIFPWDKIYIYDLRYQTIEDQVFAFTKNGLRVNIGFSARFRLKKDDLPVLLSEIGPNYSHSIFRKNIISSIRLACGNRRPSQIYASDINAVQEEVLSEMNKSLSKGYAKFESVTLVRLEIPNEVVSAIREKLVLKHEVESFVYRLEKAKKEKEVREIEATGIKIFESLSGVSMLKWRGIKATESLATSDNAKVILIGTDSNELPVILNGQNL